MNTHTEPKETSKKPEFIPSIPSLIGIGLILSGVLILLNQTLQTGWMTLLVLPILSFVVVIQGFRSGRINLIVLGTVVICLSIGGLITLALMLETTWIQKSAVGLMALGASLFSVSAVTFAFKSHPSWWALIPGSIFASTGACMVFSDNLFIIEFVNYISIGLGAAFIVLGIAKRLIGLIIPGSLLLSVGPGINQAWNLQGETNALANTGTMLVWFALGWMLIILFSKIIMPHYIWWPLIPGGVFAIVGWSLFIGGSPERALAFISNTGSIGIIILGIYLLLLRRGIGR